METVKLPPIAETMIESMRSIGYDFKSAVADLIDNSISAASKNIDIFFDIVNQPVISILDDGCGMTKDILISSMRYGSMSPIEERKKTDLGRFGLGMKSASMSMCRELIVISKFANKVTACSWDLDYIRETNGWNLKVLSESEINKFTHIDELISYESGTMLILRNFDRIESKTGDIISGMNSMFSELRYHLELVFHRFLSSGLKMRVNYDELSPIDPFLENNPKTTILREETLYIEGEKIELAPFILPNIKNLTNDEKKLVGGVESLKSKQGFYVYRAGRLIIGGTWFNLNSKHEFNKLARIRVDIPNTLDYIWDIDVMKSKADIPRKLKKNLIGLIDNTVYGSQRVITYDGKKLVNKKSYTSWNRINYDGAIKYEINLDVPEIEYLKKNLSKSDFLLVKNVLKNIELTFPYHNVYVDNGKNLIQDPRLSLEEEDLINDAIVLIDKYIHNRCRNKYDVRTFINKVLNFEMYDSEEIRNSIVMKYGEFYE
ncbi:ATP-binding protein [Mycoplasmatota bacterium zrk1]